MSLLTLLLHGLLLRQHGIVQCHQPRQQAIRLVFVKLLQLAERLYGFPANPMHLPIHLPGEAVIGMIWFAGGIAVRAPVHAGREPSCITRNGLRFFLKKRATTPTRYGLPAGTEKAVLFGKKLANRVMSSSGDVSSASSPTR